MTMRRRTTRSSSFTSAILTLALIGLIPALLGASSAMAGTTLGTLAGQVEIGSGDPTVWRQARSGEDLEPGDRVRTGSDGRAEIQMSAGTLRIHENSMLRLPDSATAEDRVELEQGYSLFDILRRMRSRFEVHTPTVVVSVKGTRFGVDVGEAVSEVAVYHGLVGVRDPAADEAIETLVREGFVAVGGGGIPFELDLAPTGDPWRDWSDPTQRPSAAIDRGRPSDEIDRIRNEVRRRTDSDVVREALRRRPELADRLERLDRRDRRNDEPSDPAGDGRAPGLVNGLPAALDPAERGPGRRNLLDRIGSEREPGRDLGGREAVGDRDGRAAGHDDAQVGGHGRRGHGHADRHPVARGEAALAERARDPARQPLQAAIGPALDLRVGAGPPQDRRLIGRGPEAALGHVQLGLGQPRRPLDAAGVGRGQAEDVLRPGAPEADPELLDHEPPVAGPVLHRPALEGVVPLEAQLAGEPGHVRLGRLVGVGAPGRQRAEAVGVPAVGQVGVEEGVDRERDLGREDELLEAAPAGVGRPLEGLDEGGRLGGPLGRQADALEDLGGRGLRRHRRDSLTLSRRRSWPSGKASSCRTAQGRPTRASSSAARTRTRGPSSSSRAGRVSSSSSRTRPSASTSPRRTSRRRSPGRSKAASAPGRAGRSLRPRNA